MTYTRNTAAHCVMITAATLLTAVLITEPF